MFLKILSATAISFIRNLKTGYELVGDEQGVDEMKSEDIWLLVVLGFIILWLVLLGTGVLG